MRAVPLEQAILALEVALAADDPLEQVRGFIAAMREANTAPPEALQPIIAPGF